MEMQKTIFGETIPVTSHRDDIVLCSDGEERRRENALADCDGGWHGDDEARLEANGEIVGKILDAREKWSCEYNTENGDSADGYAGIVDERSDGWNDRVKEWIEDNYDDEYDCLEHDPDVDDLGYNELIDFIVASVCDELEGQYDCEPEFHGSEYACYSGKGCCLDSFDIGEVEEQISINDHPELKVLHDAGELDDVLDEVESDYHHDYTISRQRRRVKNEKTGHYECIGRETYMPYEHSADYPTFEIYVMPGGQWQFVVSAERMEELVTAAVMEFFGYED
jgi:hypothetical protein